MPPESEVYKPECTRPLLDYISFVNFVKQRITEKTGTYLFLTTGAKSSKKQRNVRYIANKTIRRAEQLRVQANMRQPYSLRGISLCCGRKRRQVNNKARRLQQRDSQCTLRNGAGARTSRTNLPRRRSCSRSPRGWQRRGYSMSLHVSNVSRLNIRQPLR